MFFLRSLSPYSISKLKKKKRISRNKKKSSEILLFWLLWYSRSKKREYDNVSSTRKERLQREKPFDSSASFFIYFLSFFFSRCLDYKERFRGRRICITGHESQMAAAMNRLQIFTFLTNRIGQSDSSARSCAIKLMCLIYEKNSLARMGIFFIIEKRRHTYKGNVRITVKMTLQQN